MLDKLKKQIRKVLNYETWLTLKTLLSKTKGVTEDSEANAYVVSLTSIPSRINKVHLVTESLLGQTHKPAAVVLWLSEFNRDGKKVLDKDSLPRLLKRQEKRGLQIRFCDDIRSYRKLLPTIELYKDCHVVTADDGIIYPKDWLEKLVKVHKQFPECVICYRGVEIKIDQTSQVLKPYIQWPEFINKNKPSYFLFPQGGEGTVYPSKTFNDELFNKSVFLDICLTADDVWFKAMSLLNGKKCVKITERHNDFLRVRESQGNDTLHFINNMQGQNDVQIKEVFNKYNLLEKLISETR